MEKSRKVRQKKIKGKMEVSADRERRKKYQLLYIANQSEVKYILLSFNTIYSLR